MSSYSDIYLSGCYLSLPHEDILRTTYRRLARDAIAVHQQQPHQRSASLQSEGGSRSSYLTHIALNLMTGALVPWPGCPSTLRSPGAPSMQVKECGWCERHDGADIVPLTACFRPRGNTLPCLLYQVVRLAARQVQH